MISPEKYITAYLKRDFTIEDIGTYYKINEFKME